MKILMLILIGAAAYGIGYASAWIAHGKLLERVKNTHFYYFKRHYSLKKSWEYAKVTL